MIPTLSILETTSAMARHAGHVHAVTAHNVARADVPGAYADEAASFVDALQRFSDGEAAATRRTRAPLVLDDQMTVMARNAGRHDAAVTVWSKVLDMVRLAGASPR